MVEQKTSLLWGMFRRVFRKWFKWLETVLSCTYLGVI